jgi:hypothetical protein
MAGERSSRADQAVRRRSRELPPSAGPAARRRALVLQQLKLVDQGVVEL